MTQKRPMSRIVWHHPPSPLGNKKKECVMVFARERVDLARLLCKTRGICIEIEHPAHLCARKRVLCHADAQGRGHRIQRLSNDGAAG